MALLILITATGFVLRAAVAFRSGIWADEGFFLRVVAIPSPQAMISFLAAHESHPPLYYLLVRGWIAMVSHGDRSALLFPVVTGTALIPLAYVVGRSLVSRKAGLVAAGLVCISPLLIEQSAQLRPYALLALLSLGSTWLLGLAVTRRENRTWFAYGVATLCMLYTHNWGWIVAGGQVIAAIAAAFHLRRDFPYRQFMLTLAAVVLGYSPWISALLFQARHAGHSGLPLESLSDALIIVLLAAFTAVQAVIPSTPQHAALEAVVILIGCVAAVWFSRWNAKRDSTISTSDDTRWRESVLLLAAISSLVIATVLSPLSNLLLPRCLSSLVPVVLVLIAVKLDTYRGTAKGALFSLIAATVVVSSAFGYANLMGSTKSNAREVAVELSRQSRDSDLMIVAPEWYGPAVEHYMTRSLATISYPDSRRGGLVDFADVWERTVDPARLNEVVRRIENARASSVRIWLVTSKQYEAPLSKEELDAARGLKQPKPVTVAAIARMRASLEKLYGAPALSIADEKGKPMYENVRAYLFVPPGSQ